MVKQGVHKFGIVAASSLVVLALASTPAKAHHNHSIVGPAVAFIALSTLFHHGHHGHHGHYRGGHGHGHSGHHYRKRRHSHSHGGYHKPRRKHYNH